VLAANDYDDRRDPVIIQSFETANLRDLAPRTKVHIAQLIDCSGAPYDLTAGR
jgi:glycerophosphoryl diester phosphodiesterase